MHAYWLSIPFKKLLAVLCVFLTYQSSTLRAAAVSPQHAGALAAHRARTATETRPAPLEPRHHRAALVTAVACKAGAGSLGWLRHAVVAAAKRCRSERSFKAGCTDVALQSARTCTAALTLKHTCINACTHMDTRSVLMFERARCSATLMRCSFVSRAWRRHHQPRAATAASRGSCTAACGRLPLRSSVPGGRGTWPAVGIDRRLRGLTSI